MALTVGDAYVNIHSSNIEKDTFINLCRACMSQSKNMECVFTAEATRTIEDLEFCTGIHITKEDGLPTKLCDLCLTTLAIAYKFKTMCMKSDEIFRKLAEKQYQSLDTKTIKVEIERVTGVDSCGIEYQQLETKPDIGDDDDMVYDNGDEFLCNIKLPNPKSRTRHKTKAKNKIGKHRSKEKIKGNIGGVRRKKILKDALNSDDLDILDQTEGKERKLCCLICDMAFDSHEEQMQHRKEQHADCEWICEICGKTFKHRSSHYSHVRSHLPPTHQCGQCEYRTWHKADLNKHLRVHNGIKNYVCEYCTKRFHNSSNLRGHIRRNHSNGNIEKTHVCPRCDRAFYAADKLRRHLDTHDNIKRFECEVCHDRFSRRCQWKIHLTKNHNILIPKVRPGRPKMNVIVGAKDATDKQDLKCDFN